MKECRPETLAVTRVGKVTACTTCRVVSVEIGAITLRFDPESFEDLWLLVSEAVIRLRTMERRRGAVTSIAPGGEA